MKGKNIYKEPKNMPDAEAQVRSFAAEIEETVGMKETAGTQALLGTFAKE